MSRATRRNLSTIGGLLLLFGCSTQTIQVKILKPAAVNLARYKTIAIDDFRGRAGVELAEDISIGLSNAKNALTGEKGFTIVDRQNMDKILEELRRQRGDLWNPETARQLGRIIGVGILIHGRVDQPPVNDTIKVSKSVDEKTGEETLYKTRVATAKLTAYIKASNVETGEVSDEIKYTEETSRSTRAVNENPPAIDHASLYAANRWSVVQKYNRRVLPHEIIASVTLYIDGDFPQLESGNRYAQAGNWEKSIELYRQTLDVMTGQLEELRYKALFNLGVALKFTNQFDEARQSLQEAYARKPDTFILNEIQSLSQREEEYRRLMEQNGEEST